MAKKNEYERVGGGSYGIYRKKPKPPFDWGALFGGIVVIFIILAVLGNLAG
ncbi:hypothetical protein [Roseibium sp.]|uniref:hypothetical protein n=1 Tax=Roseibium sp. TaxID=1936156 RepID=UPI003A97A1E1